MAYLTKFPSLSKDLILYGTFTKDVMVMKANWCFYDCAFHKGREIFKYSLRQDLHFKATNPCYPLFNDPRTPPAPRGSFQRSNGENRVPGFKQPYAVTLSLSVTASPSTPLVAMHQCAVLLQAPVLFQAPVLHVSRESDAPERKRSWHEALRQRSVFQTTCPLDSRLAPCQLPSKFAPSKHYSITTTIKSL